MKVAIITSPSTNDKITNDELRFASRFMFRMMVSERIHNTVNVVIDSTDESVLVDKYGLTVPEFKPHPKKFKIHLDLETHKTRILRTLAHELVHVKQFTKNELGYSCIIKNDVIYSRWKRTLVNEQEFHYDDLPWEIEANGREESLVRRYRDFVKTNKIKFLDHL